MSEHRLRIGFIPLCDATALIVAVDKGFAAAEGLDVELVREVSWSNIRDKLNIGLFDAAHLIAPVAIASSLGIGHVKVPIVAPFGLGLNGNAITVSPPLYAAIAAAAVELASEASGQRGHAKEGDILDPMVSARALARVVAQRKARGEEPLTFGMTFPFSTHNYHLRFWMAAGGVDPDEDVRLVVLPPPYMVESLANKHVDGFCVGAPWNSVAVDLGIGCILHFVSEILARAAEKVLGVRAKWAQEHPDLLARLVRAHGRAAAFVEDPANRNEVAAILAAPNRIDVAREVIARTLDGRMKVAPDGTVRQSDRYLIIGRKGAGRPEPRQAAWLYAQMVRWGQAPLSAELLATAKAVFRPDLYDAAIGEARPDLAGEPADGIGAFAGPDFDPNDIEAHLANWKIRRG
jgi:two-component system, oxyanion-binding sensor